MLKHFATSAALVLLLSACQSSSGVPGSTSGKLTVVASLYPYADFASKVAGPDILVQNLVPAGVEPHDYEPSPREIQAIYSTSLFIYNGAGMDEWVNKILPDLKDRGVPVLNLSSGMTGLAAAHENPHFWLDPVLAQKQVEVIRDALIKADPAHAATYESNAQKTLSALRALDADFAAGLKTCDRREAITTHNAFGHLAARYSLELIPMVGLSPDAEPPARAMAGLVKLMEKKKITTVFFEALASPKLAETLARETGAKTLLLDPIEGLREADRKAGKDYFLLMRENLKNLKIALQCH